LLGGEAGAFDAVDDVEQAELDGVGHGDTEIQIPGRGAGRRKPSVESRGRRGQL
jgi:hypothetical protein